MSAGDPRLADALSRGWYHSIDLAPGATTRGAVDLRPIAGTVLPERLDGLRALDIGTFDGFWAFALEARGAAEVVATDLERFDQSLWPPRQQEANAAEAGDNRPGERFGLARDLLGSKVQRVITSINELEVETLGGPVDFAVIGDLLIHLRDPVGGLERVHAALRPGGRLLSLEQVSVPLTLRFPFSPVADLETGYTRMNWWEPNLRAHRDWLRTAGFRPRLKRIYKLQAAGAQAKWHSAWIATKR